MVVVVWCLVIMVTTVACADTRAVIIVPVADMLLHKAGNKEIYSSLPCMGEQGFRGCPRVHQCLFNETVDVVGYDGDEVCVSIKNSFYGYNPVTGEFFTNMWTLRDNLMLYKELPPDAPIPSTIDYANPRSLFDQDVVTLKLPWHDPLNNRSYSVGTRFKRLSLFDTPNEYAVAFFSPHHKDILTAFIPRVQATVVQRQDKQLATQLFVNLLDLWIDYARKKNGIIPYVWGGSSFTHAYKEDSFCMEKRWHSGMPATCWFRKEAYVPSTGFDCSELILRACQIAGIPYFFKNSSTMAHHLRPLAQDEHCQLGDLVLVPGHVMVISSCKDNKVTEAAGYHKLYGDVHNMPVEKIFDGITNLAQLQEAYRAKKPITLKDKKGTIIETHPQCMIFKLTAFDIKN